MDKEIIGIINKYEKRLDNKSEQTTYKIKYVTSYVRNWLAVMSNAKHTHKILTS